MKWSAWAVAGATAINTMIASGLPGVEFIAANTDMQALGASLASSKVQLGAQLTKGLGAGANPDIGRQAALEDAEAIRDHLAGAARKSGNRTRRY
jgi:cell division protein FtsZ